VDKLKVDHRVLEASFPASVADQAAALAFLVASEVLLLVVVEACLAAVAAQALVA